MVKTKQSALDAVAIAPRTCLVTDTQLTDVALVAMKKPVGAEVYFNGVMQVGATAEFELAFIFTEVPANLELKVGHKDGILYEPEGFTVALGKMTSVNMRKEDWRYAGTDNVAWCLKNAKPAAMPTEEDDTFFGSATDDASTEQPEPTGFVESIGSVELLIAKMWSVEQKLADFEQLFREKMAAVDSVVDGVKRTAREVMWCLKNSSVTHQALIKQVALLTDAMLELLPDENNSADATDEVLKMPAIEPRAGKAVVPALDTIGKRSEVTPLAKLASSGPAEAAGEAWREFSANKWPRGFDVLIVGSQRSIGENWRSWLGAREIGYVQLPGDNDHGFVEIAERIERASFVLFNKANLESYDVVRMHSVLGTYRRQHANALVLEVNVPTLSGPPPHPALWQALSAVANANSANEKPTTTPVVG